MTVLLDTTVLSNFARVKIDHVLQEIWSDQVCVTVEVAEEYQAGVKAGRLPSLASKELKILTLTPEEAALESTMPQRLGVGERASIAMALNRGAAIATDDALARRVANELGIAVTGTIGILQRCIARQILSVRQAQHALEGMIAAGYYSPARNLKDE